VLLLLLLVGSYQQQQARDPEPSRPTLHFYCCCASGHNFVRRTQGKGSVHLDQGVLHKREMGEHPGDWTPRFHRAHFVLQLWGSAIPRKQRK